MFQRVPPIALAGLIALVVIIVGVAIALATGGIAPHCTAPSGVCATPTATIGP